MKKTTLKRSLSRGGDYGLISLLVPALFLDRPLPPRLQACTASPGAVKSTCTGRTTLSMRPASTLSARRTSAASDRELMQPSERVTTNVTVYIDATVAPEKAYWYRVAAVNGPVLRSIRTRPGSSLQSQLR